MRRIQTEPKKCEGCGDWMFRKHRGYQLEPPTVFARRKYHDRACYAAAQLTGRLTSGRSCWHCSEPIVRKKFGRYYEPKGQFRRRRFCTKTCWLLWIADPLNAIAYGAQIKATRDKRRRSEARAAEGHRASQARYAERRKVGGGAR